MRSISLLLKIHKGESHHCVFMRLVSPCLSLAPSQHGVPMSLAHSLMIQRPFLLLCLSASMSFLPQHLETTLFMPSTVPDERDVLPNEGQRETERSPPPPHEGQSHRRVAHSLNLLEVNATAFFGSRISPICWSSHTSCFYFLSMVLSGSLNVSIMCLRYL